MYYKITQAGRLAAPLHGILEMILFQRSGL